MVIEPGNSLNSHNTSTAKTRQSKPDNSEAQDPKSNTAPQSSDSVSLSPEARVIAQIEASIASSSDVDAEKISQIKAAIADGSYKVDAQAIAKGIIDDESLLG